MIRKYLGITFLIGGILLFVYPVKSEVPIVKSEITSIRPFGGCINNQFIGSDVCCEYWRAEDKQPEVQTYIV